MGVKVIFRKGKWCISVNHARHRCIKAIGTTKEAAVTVAKQVELQLAMNDLGVFGIGTGKGDIFRVYADRWLVDGAAGRKATYQRWLTYNISDHLNPVLGDRPVADISRADARTLVGTLRKGGAKIHVVKAAVRVASAVLSQAVDDGLRQANPFFRMGKHTQSADELVNDEPVRAMSRDQAQAFLATVQAGWPDHFAFYLTALRTGLRLGELLGLKWDHVDLEGRLLHLRLAYTGGRFTTLKNKKRRSVDMSDQLAAALRSHLVAMKARALAAGLPLPELVFGAADGKPLDADNLRKRVHAKVMKQAGLVFTIHELRHTYASLLISLNKSLAFISRQMGHGSIQITVDTYGHMVPTTDRSAVNSLDDQPVLSTTGVK